MRLDGHHLTKEYGSSDRLMSAFRHCGIGGNQVAGCQLELIPSFIAVLRHRDHAADAAGKPWLRDFILGRQSASIGERLG